MRPLVQAAGFSSQLRAKALQGAEQKSASA
jgi:hypothetical protein